MATTSPQSFPFDSVTSHFSFSSWNKIIVVRSQHWIFFDLKCYTFCWQTVLQSSDMACPSAPSCAGSHYRSQLQTAFFSGAPSWIQPSHPGNREHRCLSDNTIMLTHGGFIWRRKIYHSGVSKTQLLLTVKTLSPPGLKVSSLTKPSDAVPIVNTGCHHLQTGTISDP